MRQQQNAGYARKSFVDGDKKVRDHCHHSGKFRGAAHNKCNLLFRKPKHVPVILHNLAGYDSHLFIKSIGKRQGNSDCIPNNEEKYISFSKSVMHDGKLKYKNHFIDSFKFMTKIIFHDNDKLCYRGCACTLASYPTGPSPPNGRAMHFKLYLPVYFKIHDIAKDIVDFYSFCEWLFPSLDSHTRRT